jgi:spoIIIJ-associated protein
VSSDAPEQGDPTDGGAEEATTAVTGVDVADDEAAADDGSEGGGGDDDGAEDDGSGDGAGAAGDKGSLLVREGDIAADYLERLLDIVDYDGDIDLDVENGRAMVAIVGSDLQPLIGPDGATLDALQELTRLAVQQRTGVRSRLMLDVSGHRRARRTELTELAREVADEVLASGQSKRLSPMNPFERKVVHDAIADIKGVVSESEGEEPARRVVVLPA